ncbi:hypothetical protein ABT255_02145 [Streptomyces mirabilis]|uniref:hypothetical protein n=1 Tax=Streptomyces mirabilis TaxID=68239 RepID=UPI0033211293
MRIPTDVLAALSGRTKTGGHRLMLVGPRVATTLYQRVNEVLEAVGGRWTKTEGAHLFPIDAAEALAPVLAAGEVVPLRENASPPCAEARDGVLGRQVILDDGFERFVTQETVGKLTANPKGG